MEVQKKTFVELIKFNMINKKRSEKNEVDFRWKMKRIVPKGFFS